MWQASAQSLGLLAQTQECPPGTHGLSGKQETREVVITKPGGWREPGTRHRKLCLLSLTCAQALPQPCSRGAGHCWVTAIPQSQATRMPHTGGHTSATTTGLEYPLAFPLTLGNAPVGKPQGHLPPEFLRVMCGADV